VDGGWPLVGRDHELERIARSFGGHRGTLLAGAPGMGRTRLARAASSLVSPPAAWFGVAGTTPFATFARLLVRPGGPLLVDRFRGAAAELLAAGEDVLVVVDDAHRLDEASLAFLHHLVDTTAVRLLLTASTEGEAAPLLTGLWKDGALERIELEPLGPAAMSALVAAALPGPVRPDLARWLVTAAAGAPLLLRELLADALERGAVTFEDGGWHRRPPAAPPTSRLRELVGARVVALHDEERRAAGLLALAGRLPLAVLEGLASPGVVVALERRGVLMTDEDHRRRTVALAHPIDGEVLLGDLGRAQEAALLRELLAGLEAAGAHRLQDRVQLARWRVRLGDVPDWRAVLDVGRELAAAPHRQVADLAAPAPSYALPADTHLRTALELARGAEEHGGGLDAALLAGALHLRMGDAEGAAEVDRRLDALATSDEDRRLVARLRAHRGDQSLIAADDDRAVAAVALAVGGRPQDALGAAADVLSGVGASSNDRLLAVAASAGALCQLGRTAEAAELAAGALRAVGPHEAPGAVWSLVIARLYALLLGGRLDEAESIAASCREVAADAGGVDGVAGIEVALASAALAQGRPATAVRWTTSALASLTDAELRRAALAVEAHARATLGEAAAAAAILDELEADPTRYLAIGPQLLRARAWAVVAGGSVAEAVDGLLLDAARCRTASAFVGELGLLHDVARLGRPALVADRVAEVVAGMDDLLPALVLAHVVAIRDDDGPGLERVAEQFAALGAAVLEAEAWAQASGAHQRAGHPARANAVAVRSRVVAARCEGARTPGMSLGAPAPELTRREREVVGLAAGGLGDRAIAAQLALSTRTVETHLSRAYAKLGVTGRADLAAALGLPAD
jgi:DNA-binding CsgD family transcriptional regulator